MKLTGMDVDMIKNFLERTPVKLAIKGSQVEKTDNPQVFMTSNNDLGEMVDKKYHNGNEEEKKIVLDALRARIDEVC